MIHLRLIWFLGLAGVMPPVAAADYGCLPPAAAQAAAEQEPARWQQLYAQCWAELQYLRAHHPSVTPVPRFWLPPPGLLPAY